MSREKIKSDLYSRFYFGSAKLNWDLWKPKNWPWNMWRCFMLHASCFMLHASCFMLHFQCFNASCFVLLSRVYYLLIHFLVFLYFFIYFPLEGHFFYMKSCTFSIWKAAVRRKYPSLCNTREGTRWCRFVSSWCGDQT